jgi:hypothetical protein
LTAARDAALDAAYAAIDAAYAAWDAAIDAANADRDADANKVYNAAIAAQTKEQTDD